MRSTALLCTLLPLLAGAQNHMTPELLWKLHRVSAEGVSGDGKTLYYASRTYDVPADKSATVHYALDISSGAKTALKEDKKIFRRGGKSWYATEGNKIYQSNDAGKSWKIFLPALENADNIQVSPDGSYVAFSREVMIAPTMGTDLYPDLKKNTAQVYTDLNYRHWDTWEDGKYSHIFIMPVRGGSIKDIMEGQAYDAPGKPFGGTEDFAWRPDGKGLVYVCKKKAGKAYAQSTNSDLYYYNVKTGKTTNWTPDNNGYDTNPTFNDEGTLMAWTGMEHDGFESDKNDLFVLDLKTMTPRNLTAKWDGTVGSYQWAKDGKKIYFVAPVRGTEQLFELATTDKAEPVQLTKGKFDINGIVGEAGGELIVSRSDMNHASEIYAFNAAKGTLRPLSRENDEQYKGVGMSNTVLRMVKTSDNKEMGVWVVYPPDFDSTKKYPVLLYCQGGPQSALTQFYSFRWNFQLMAAQGYIVVAPNRRGMPGWGSEWNAAISKDWGGQPMRDYLAAIDDVAKEKYADKSRMGCVGASYGGYSVFMLAGMHDKRFRTFIAHDGLFDLKSWYGTTEELWFANWDIGGSYWQKPGVKSYEAYNPSNFVDKWNAPIMIVQGGIDYRVPVEQGLEAFQAAQLRGIKSKLLYLPDENHWVLHPQNALVWQREFYKWLDETMK